METEDPVSTERLTSPSHLEHPPGVMEADSFEPPKKSQLDFAFKFIKQSILTALEETESALTQLEWLDQQSNKIPADMSEQEIMIMEETAQVRTKVARQLLKSLRSYKPRTDVTGDHRADKVEEMEEGDGSVGVSPSAKAKSLAYHKYYKCKLCPSRFHKQTHLRCHVRLSHYKLSFVCTKCHNHFQSKQRLKHHRCPVEHPTEAVSQPEEDEEEEEEEEVSRGEVVEEEEVEEQPYRPHHQPLPHHGPITIEKYNGDEDAVQQESPVLQGGPTKVPADQMAVDKSAYPCPSNNSSVASSRSGHSSNEDQDDSPKQREISTPGTSPEATDDAMRDYRNGSIPQVSQNIMRTPSMPYMPEVNYYMKDSPTAIDRDRSFFQQRRDVPLPPIPLHRFDTAFGNPLPSIIPRPGQPPDIRGQYENGSLSNLPSPIPTTQPLQSFLGKKELPLLNIQKNNAFISQLIAASCIPTASSTSTSNVFTSQTTPTSGNTFETSDATTSSTTPTQEYAPPPPPAPPLAKAPGHASQPSSNESGSAGGGPGDQGGAAGGNMNQFLDYKKYACKICHRKFSQRSSLNRHVYTIHWNMKIKCAFCTKTYTQKCLLKQHVYEEHGVEACLQMFSANERINWKMQLVNSQKQRLNMSADQDQEGGGPPGVEGKSMKQEASSS